MADEHEIRGALGRALAARGFREQPADGVAGCWVRRTATTNRAVLLLAVPEGIEDPAPWARTQRARCARAVGFRIPLLYHPGIQVVTLGPAAQSPPSEAVDRYDNQWCVIQAIHVVDLAANQVTSAATWGQVVSGTDQDAVAQALSAVLSSGGQASVGPDSGERPMSRAQTPTWVRLALLGGGLVIVGRLLVWLAG